MYMYINVVQKEIPQNANRLERYMGPRLVPGPDPLMRITYIQTVEKLIHVSDELDD